MKRNKTNRVSAARPPNAKDVHRQQAPSPSVVRLGDSIGAPLPPPRDVTAVSFEYGAVENSVPLVLGNASESVMWRQYRRHTSSNGVEGKSISIPAAIEEIFHQKPYGTRLRGLEALGEAFKKYKTKVVGCSFKTEGVKKEVRYYIRDDDDDDDVAEHVAPGGGGDEKKAPSTQSLVKIKSVTQNLALAYDNWITDVDLEDHGLLAFHVQGLVAKMAEAYKVEHDGKNDEAEQDAAKYFDLPAEFLKPFATIDASTRERKSETLSELLIDQWGLDPPRTIISVIGSRSDLDLRPAVEQLLRDGLVKAANTGTTWFLTNGYSTGVAHFVGEVLRDNDCNAPVIGCSQWDLLDQRPWHTPEGRAGAGAGGSKEKRRHAGGLTLMDEDEHKHVARKVATDRKLDAHHTHFVFVSGGDHTNPDGPSDQYRRTLEKNMSTVDKVVSFGLFCTESPVTCVALVLAGGVGTIRQCAQRVGLPSAGRHRTQVLVVANTGGAADVIAYAWKLVHEPDSGNTYEGLDLCISDELGMAAAVGETGDMITKEVLQLVHDGMANLTMQIFDPEVAHKPGLDFTTVMLGTMMRDDDKWVDPDYSARAGELGVTDQEATRRNVRRRDLRRCYRLEMALAWDHLEMATALIKENRFLSKLKRKDKPGNHDFEPGGTVFAQMRMLMYSLLGQGRAEFAKLCIAEMQENDLEYFLRFKLNTFQAFDAGSKAAEDFSPVTTTPTGLDLFDETDFEVPLYILKTQWFAITAYNLGMDPKLQKKGKGTVQPSKNFREKMRRKSMSVVEDASKVVNKASSAIGLGNRGKEDDNESVRTAKSVMSGAKPSDYDKQVANEAVLAYYLKLFLSAGLAMSIDEAHEQGERPATDPEMAGKVVTLIAKTMHHSWLLCIDDTDNQTEAHQLYDNLGKKEQLPLLLAADHVFRVLDDAGLRLWKSDNLEDLFLRAQPTDTDGTASHYLMTLFPRGHCLRQDVYQRTREMVGTPSRGFCASPEQIEGLCPYYLLMVWSLCTNRPELAKFFWGIKPEKCVLNALVAGQICHELPVLAKLTPEVTTSLSELLNFFEGSTNRILQHCQHADSGLTVELMKACDGESGNIPLWYLAYDLKAQEITASTAYQTIIKDEWYGAVDQDNWTLKILVAILFPPLLLVFNPYAITAEEDMGETPGNKAWYETLIDGIAIRMDHAVMRKAEGSRPKFLLVGGDWFTMAKKRVMFFYDAPITTFYFECMAYLVFAVLFSIGSIAPASGVDEVLKLDDDYKRMQLALWFWVFAVCVDEVDQMVSEGLRNWFRSMWNKWDLLMYSLILLAIGIRSFEGDEAMRRSKLFSGVAALLVWMRATRFFAFSKTLGPKLHMVQEMIGDVAVFCALLILILIGYGVSYVIIQMPWRSFDDHVMADIVYRPTFMVFGETFLDGLHSESDCLDPDGFKNCSVNTYVSLFFLGFYLLVCNILLVNLLIAMMSSTYERVAEESIQIWSLQNTDLLEEFREKFPLPAPLNLLYNLSRILTSLVGAVRGLCRKGSPHSEDVATGTWQGQRFGLFLLRQFDKFKEEQACETENRFKEMSGLLHEQSTTIDGLRSSLARLSKQGPRGGAASSSTAASESARSTDKKAGSSRSKRRTKAPGSSPRKAAAAADPEDGFTGILNSD